MGYGAASWGLEVYTTEDDGNTIFRSFGSRTLTEATGEQRTLESSAWPPQQQ